MCEWKWFSDGQLVSDPHERHIRFARTPFTLRAARPAGVVDKGTVQLVPAPNVSLLRMGTDFLGLSS